MTRTNPSQSSGASFVRQLCKLVNAMPRAIRFPYGPQAFGLATYSAIPKHGKAPVQTAAQRFLAAVEAPATEKVW